MLTLMRGEERRQVQCEIHQHAPLGRLRRRLYEYDSTIEIDIIILLEW
jgi:hypothetical protein